jgi:hypothetical protein
MRNSERKDVFYEKFVQMRPPSDLASLARKTHKPTKSNGSYSSTDDGVGIRSRELAGRDRAGTDASAGTSGSHTSSPPTGLHSPSDNSSLVGSVAWAGDDGSMPERGVPQNGGVANASNLNRGRRSTDASSTSSHNAFSRPPIHPGSSDPHLRAGFVKDTHFLHTTIEYKGVSLPIRLPLATFPEEVGDVSCFSLSWVACLSKA